MRSTHVSKCTDMWEPSVHLQSSNIQMLVCLMSAFLFRGRWIEPIREPTLKHGFKSNGFAIYIPELEGAALEFAERKGFGPLSVDSNGWTLLHHAAVQSQHGRGMLEVARGWLEAVPIEVVDQRTKWGYANGMGGVEPCLQRPRRGQRAR